jgi:hypothetical protein
MYYKVFLDYCYGKSTSGWEAFDTGLLQHGKDIIVVNKDRQMLKRNMLYLWPKLVIQQFVELT